MNKKVSVILSGLILTIGLVISAKAAYYTDNTRYAHSNYVEKLNLLMDGVQDTDVQEHILPVIISLIIVIVFYGLVKNKNTTTEQILKILVNIKR